MTTDEFLKICNASHAEQEFVLIMKKFARIGVGYGWMQRAIEVEWSQHVPHCWGPAYFSEKIKDIEEEIAQLESKLESKKS